MFKVIGTPVRAATLIILLEMSESLSDVSVSLSLGTEDDGC